MSKVFLVLLVPLLAFVGNAFAADIQFTAGSGPLIAAPADGSGKLHTQPMVCDATTPTNCAPVSTSTGLVVSAPSGAALATSSNQSTANTTLSSILSAVTGPVPAGTAIIGKVTTDQTTPGTTDLVHAAQSGTWTFTTNATSSGSAVAVVQPDSQVAVSISTATTTQLVALSSGKKIYVTAWDIFAAGTGGFQLVYGTGSNCGTGTTNLTGSYSLIAQTGLSRGGSLGVLYTIPASNALCAVTTGAVQMSGSVSYTQF